MDRTTLRAAFRGKNVTSTARAVDAETNETYVSRVTGAVPASLTVDDFADAGMHGTLSGTVRGEEDGVTLTQAVKLTGAAARSHIQAMRASAADSGVSKPTKPRKPQIAEEQPAK